MLLIMIFHIRGGKMSEKEIEKEWQEELKKFVDHHSKKIKGMSQEEEMKYIKENKVNEKIKELQEKYKHYSTKK